MSDKSCGNCKYLATEDFEKTYERCELKSVDASKRRQFVEQFVIYNALRQGNEDWSWDDFVKAAIAAWEAIEKEFVA